MIFYIIFKKMNKELWEILRDDSARVGDTIRHCQDVLDKFIKRLKKFPHIPNNLLCHEEVL